MDARPIPTRTTALNGEINPTENAAIKQATTTHISAKTTAASETTTPKIAPKIPIKIPITVAPYAKIIGDAKIKRITISAIMPPLIFFLVFPASLFI